MSGAATVSGRNHPARKQQPSRGRRGYCAADEDFTSEGAPPEQPRAAPPTLRRLEIQCRDESEADAASDPAS